MTASDALEALRLAHAQWSNRYLDQIEPEDYPGLLDSMEAAIKAWEKERAERMGDAEGFAQKVDELATLRAEVLKVAEEMGTFHKYLPAWQTPEGFYKGECDAFAARLRKACE